MKKTKIIAAFNACGKTYEAAHAKEGLVILDISYGNFSFVQRKRTPEELEAIRKEWDSEPHLLSGEGYVNQIKNDTIVTPNSNAAEDFVAEVKKHIGTADIVFVDTSTNAREALRSAGIDYILVYPDEILKEEWVGRIFLQGNNNYICNYIATNWDLKIEALECDSFLNNRETYVLQHGQHIADIDAYQKMLGSALLYEWECSQEKEIGEF